MPWGINMTNIYIDKLEEITAVLGGGGDPEPSDNLYIAKLNEIIAACEGLLRLAGTSPAPGNIAVWESDSELGDAGYAASDVARLSQQNVFTDDQVIENGNLHFPGMTIGHSGLTNTMGIWPTTDHATMDPVLTWTLSPAEVVYINTPTAAGVIHIMHGFAAIRVSISDTELLANIPIRASQGIIVEDWQYPALMNNWIPYGAPYPLPSFMKDPMGYVHMKGLIKNGTYGSDVFQLPMGYRPSERLHIATVADTTFAYLHINTDGRVEANGDTDWLSLTVAPFQAA